MTIPVRPKVGSILADKYRAWGIYASGVLPDGAMALLIEIRSGKQRWSWDAKVFTLVICEVHGIFRLRTNGSTKRLGNASLLPMSLHSNRRELLNLLSPHMPSAWGKSEDMLSISIPERVLQSNSPNLARLLLAWSKVQEVLARSKSLTSERLLTDAVLPHPYDRRVKVAHPVAITIIPSTYVVIEALNTGILVERLKLGLERIYISEMNWIRTPRMRAPLLALQRRFAGRLVLVKAQAFNRIAEILNVRRWSAAEYQFIGDQLKERYQNDFGYDKYENPKALSGMYRYRVGDVPRGHAMLWMGELDVSLQNWVNFDIDAMKAREVEVDMARSIQGQRAQKAMARLVPPKVSTEP